MAQHAKTREQFRALRVWQEAHVLTILVYKVKAYSMYTLLDLARGVGAMLHGLTRALHAHVKRTA